MKKFQITLSPEEEEVREKYNEFRLGPVGIKALRDKRQAEIKAARAAFRTPIQQSKSETEQQTAQEWHNAMTNSRPKPEVPTGQLDGVVTFYDSEKEFGFLRDKRQVEYFAARLHIAADEFGLKYLTLGESVSFRAEEDPNNSIRLKAVNVLPQHVDLGRSAPPDYREVMTVIEYHRNTGRGVLQRDDHPTAPWVFFTEREVITLGSIAVGVKVWCGFQRNVQSPSKFQATQIEIIKD
jgi:cold shock CspA family protein